MYEYFHLISDWILKKNETRLKCFPISMSVNANNIIIRGNVYSFTSVVTNIIFIIILGTPTKSWVSIRNAADQNHSGTAGVFFRQARGKVWPTATVLEFTAFHSRHCSPPSHNRCPLQMLVPGSLQWNTHLWHQLIPDLLYQTLAFQQSFQRLHYFRKWTDFWKMFTRRTEKCQVWQNTRFWIRMHSFRSDFLLK